MFEITPEDVSRLDDTQLRAVVARLCEAELSSQGLSTSAITWGGNQTAPDGGIDAMVSIPDAGALRDGFIPRAITGFQVKKEDMPPAKIRNEMRPNGALRKTIRDLVIAGEAYIIVSSEGDLSHAVLDARLSAMRAALGRLPQRGQLHIDFYDRTRIATWVRAHPALIPFVRFLVDRPIRGWRSYEAWAFTPEGVEDEYLLDESARLRSGSRQAETGVPVLQGIQLMRDLIRLPQSVLRLVGLSGVGKTCLAQALFDSRVGSGSLDPSLAFYTDLSNQPDPTPDALITDLIAARSAGIVVVDNCPPDVHARLTALVRSQNSKVNLVTIEYDVREDQPEGTDVFVLEGSSSDLIYKLLRRRYPAISQVDAQTVVEACGGNARLAITLSSAIERTGSAAGLTDEQLFSRLFYQGRSTDERLYLAGQACSFVYSFDSEGFGDASELRNLANLIGTTPLELSRNVAELQRRDLMQSRGKWQAVLPQALANRLARVGLQNIPYSLLERNIVASGNVRLLKSFSRRIGLLHNCAEARAIARTWLAPDGILACLHNLGESGRAIFNNVASCVPAETLAALERSSRYPDAANVALSADYIPTIRLLAYDANHFERAVRILVSIAETETKERNTKASDAFASLFQLRLPAHAPAYSSKSESRTNCLVRHDRNNVDWVWLH